MSFTEAVGKVAAAKALDDGKIWSLEVNEDETWMAYAHRDLLPDSYGDHSFTGATWWEAVMGAAALLEGDE